MRSLPVRGAWIEICLNYLISPLLQSLPVRGAWIEIFRRRLVYAAIMAVAPRAGSVD